MTKNELVSNFGMIAKSSTCAFMEAMIRASGNISTIEQIGVVIYSAYLVSDEFCAVSQR